MTLQTTSIIADLERWHKAYIHNIKALSYSPNTIDLYDRVVNSFIEYMREHEDETMMKDIKNIHFTGFLAFAEDSARRKGAKIKNGNFISKSTKQTYFTAVKAFFTFISDNNDEFFAYDRSFRNAKIADKTKGSEKIVSLYKEEQKKLLDMLAKEVEKVDSYNIHRNTLLIKVMLFAGLRISEALRLKIEDFTLENINDEEIYFVRVYGKGGKYQTIQIYAPLIVEQIDFFKQASKIANDEYIMRTESGKVLVRENAYLVVNALYKRAGVNRKGLHILRHTFAMNQSAKKTYPPTIQKMMRHSNINTTMVYVKTTEEEVREALPRG